MRHDAGCAGGVVAHSRPGGGRWRRQDTSAEQARARLMRLREAAETTSVDSSDEDGAAPLAVNQRVKKRSRSRLRWLRVPGWEAVAVGAAIVLACASFAASGYIVWQHYTI